MNASSLPRTTPISIQSTAFAFGQRDARTGKVCNSCMFAQEQQQCEYQAGYDSCAVVAAKIVTPNYKANDKERVRRTDNVTYERMVQLSEARGKRLERMAEETATFLGIDDGEILFA